MGKGKAGNKKKAGGRKASTTKTAAQLLATAHECMEVMDVDAAIRCLEKAIEQEPDNVECLHLLGELYAECMETEKAKAALQQLLQAVPEEHSALLYLGQLSEGAESAGFYRRAIASMASQLAAAGSAAEPSAAELEAMQSGNMKAVPADIAAMRRRIAAACCSLVELHMTDLCDEANAEAVCEECLKQALATDPLNPEVQHQVASLRLVQQRPGDAQAAMRQAGALLHSLLEAADEQEEGAGSTAQAQTASGAGSSGGASSQHTEGGAGGGPPDAAWVPTHAARKAMAQTCLEVELWELGTSMLERLLSEHDVDFELWFLLAEAYMGGGDLGTAGLYVNEATRRLQGAVDLAAGKAPAGGAGGGSLFGMLAASGGSGASAALKELGPQGAAAALKQFGRLADALRAAAAEGGVDLAAAIAAAEADGEGGEEGGPAGLHSAVTHAVAAAQSSK